MKRNRNARYAPEFLERKLSPSATALGNAALVSPTTAAPTPVVLFGDSTYYGFDATPSTTDSTAPTPTASSGGDTLITDDGTDAPSPDEEPAPILPPSPTGPVVPALS